MVFGFVCYKHPNIEIYNISSKLSSEIKLSELRHLELRHFVYVFTDRTNDAGLIFKEKMNYFDLITPEDLFCKENLPTINKTLGKY